jgi:hypothetical protein
MSSSGSDYDSEEDDGGSSDDDDEDEEEDEADAEVVVACPTCSLKSPRGAVVAAATCGCAGRAGGGCRRRSESAPRPARADASDVAAAVAAVAARGAESDSAGRLQRERERRRRALRQLKKLQEARLAPNPTRQKALNLEGSLVLGSLSPRDASVAAPEVVPSRTHGGKHGSEAAAAEADHKERLEALRVRLVEEWPHGVPVRCWLDWAGWVGSAGRATGLTAVTGAGAGAGCQSFVICSS